MGILEVPPTSIERSIMSGLVINSGNVASALQKFVLVSTEKELHKVLETLRKSAPIPEVYESHPHQGGGHMQLARIGASPAEDIFTPRTSLHSAITADDEFEVTLKLFIGATGNSDTVSHALTECHGALGGTRIDTVVLSLPGEHVPPLGLADNVAASVAGMWTALTRHTDKATHFGVSDFSSSQLSRLVAETNVTPQVNQVNLADCCVIPTDLVQYSKEHQIRLLTHSDSKSLLEKSEIVSEIDLLIKDMVEKGAMEARKDGATPYAIQWVGRYHAIVKSRGIVSHVGFIVGVQ